MVDMMDKESRDQLKAEIKNELEQGIEDEVEEEVEEELRKQARASKAYGFVKTYFIAVVAIIMALAQFSEAVTLIESGIDWVSSKITNNVEYDLLAKIHVGNTESYVTDLMGSPQVSREIDDKITANYFDNDKFLLTVFLADERVVGYTVVPLRADFKPVVVELNSEEMHLGEFSYELYPANPQRYLIDHSKTTSYYLETLDTGRTGLFFKVYLGNVVLQDGDASPLVVDLYNKDITETDAVILNAQNILRADLKPNFFGMGTLSLEQIQKSILTGAEFQIYFGH